MDTDFVRKVSKDNENVVTEYLYSMMKQKYLRDIILLSLTSSSNKKIDIKDLDDIRHKHLKTQSQVKGGGSVDLRLENRDWLLLVENKINIGTPMQDYQITTYPVEVAKSRKKYRALIYLLPQQYHYCEEEIIKQCETSITLIESAQEDIRDLVIIKRWPDFINDLEDSEVSKDNPIVADFLNYLRNRLHLIDQTAFTKGDIITMYNPKTIKSVLDFQAKWYKFIIEVDEKIIERTSFLPSDFSGFPASDSSSIGMGKYLRKNGAPVFWFGYSYNVSFLGDNVFFCIYNTVFKDDSEQTAEEQLEKNNLYFIPKDYPEWFYFPINSFFLEDDDLHKNVDAFVEEVINLIEKYSIV